MRLVYFAWVRERIGKESEEINRKDPAVRMQRFSRIASFSKVIVAVSLMFLTTIMPFAAAIENFKHGENPQPK